MSLGENVYKHRTAKGWSQTDLADALEVSRQSISKWENDTVTPDLDKVMKMCQLFDISLDELVFGTRKEPEAPPPAMSITSLMPTRFLIGIFMLIFGMIFFLLSIFWGDHLSFGEEFGELLSAVIVILSLCLIATDNFKVLTVCAVVYFLYSIICFGIMNVTSLTNYLFTSIASLIIFVWFIVYGLNATKERSNGKLK